AQKEDQGPWLLLCFLCLLWLIFFPHLWDTIVLLILHSGALTLKSLLIRSAMSGPFGSCAICLRYSVGVCRILLINDFVIRSAAASGDRSLKCRRLRSISSRRSFSSVSRS